MKASFGSVARLRRASTERGIIALVAAVQFINVLDFMMVMPLGPDFAQALHIPSSNLGLVGGSYTAAASIAGIAGSFFLDRFDRRKALFVAMLGLALGTLLGGAATGLYSLLFARVVAGIFGGPATSLSLSIVADTVAPERRGRAMGAVMGSFSLASIAGVPLALELSRWGGWKIPFFVVGSAAIVITFCVIALLPPMRAHLKRDAAPLVGAPMFKRPQVLQMYLAVALGMFASFLMVPNLASYFQFNLGFPREHLSYLYFIGGLISLVGMRIAGKFVDRYSAFAVAVVSAVVLILVLGTGYAVVPPLIPIGVMFVGFMLAMSIRGVVISSLASRVPRQAERARYMSFQSAVQHISCATGAISSTLFLHEQPSGALIGMDRLVLVTIGLSAVVPLVLRMVERSVRREETRTRS